MNYLVFLWRGEEALKTVFWKYFVPLMVIYVFVVIFVGSASGYFDGERKNNYFEICDIIFSIVFLFLSVAIIRSAKKYEGSNAISYLAMFFGFGQAILWTFGFFQSLIIVTGPGFVGSIMLVLFVFWCLYLIFFVSASGVYLRYRLMDLIKGR